MASNPKPHSEGVERADGKERVHDRWKLVQTYNGFSSGGEYQSSMTMTISNNPPLHISHHIKIEEGRRAFFSPTMSDYWILDYTYFKGYTIIIDKAGYDLKYKFIAPKEEHKREDRQKGQ